MFESFFKKNMQSLELLPNNVLQNIFSHLTPEELAVMGLCSKTLNYYRLNELMRKNGFPKYLNSSDFKFCQQHNFPLQFFYAIKNDSRLIKQLRAIQNIFADFKDESKHLNTLLTNHSILLARKGYVECLRWMTLLGIDRNAQFDFDLISEQKTFYKTYELDEFSNVLSSIKDENCWKKKATALQLAVEQEQVACVNSLLAQGADPNTKDARGATALHYAFLSPNLEIIKNLLQAGADVHAKTSPALKTSLFLLSCEPCADSFTMVEKLLDAGADIIAQNNEGRTPLHVLLMDAAAYCQTIKDPAQCAAKYKKALSLSLFLIRHGADIEIKDRYGKTPLDYCNQKDWVYKMKYQASQCFYQTKQSLRKHCVIL